MPIRAFLYLIAIRNEPMVLTGHVILTSYCNADWNLVNVLNEAHVVSLSLSGRSASNV